MKTLTFLLVLFPVSVLAQDSGGSNTALSLLPLVLIFVVMYFLLIRPQQKRTKEHRNMTSQLKRGDEVVTTGGIYGRIRKVNDNHLDLQIARDVTIRIQRNSVASLLPDGTVSGLNDRQGGSRPGGSRSETNRSSAGGHGSSSGRSNKGRGDRRKEKSTGSSSESGNASPVKQSTSEGTKSDDEAPAK